jgi:hypothetical protein
MAFYRISEKQSISKSEVKTLRAVRMRMNAEALGICRLRLRERANIYEIESIQVRLDAAMGGTRAIDRSVLEGV